MAKDFDELVRDLEDESWEVRQDATISLGRLGDARAIEALITALGDENGDVREAVAEALGELGDAHAVEPLITALGDEDSRVHVAAAEALRRLIQRIETLIDNLDGSSKKEKPTILIVEDDLDTSDMLRALLEAQGYEVLTASWGSHALEICQKTLPDLILQDIRLPDIDGYEICRRLRDNLRTSQIPFIFLTEKREREDILHGLEIGADDYITKPFHVQELLLRCGDILSRSGRGNQALSQREIKLLRQERQELLRRIAALEQSKQIPKQTICFGEFGSLISGIVHDLRGGLGVIRNTASFLLDEVEDDSFITDLRKIAHSVEFCEVVIRNLMALGGGEVLEPVEVNIELVVREVFFMLERKLVDVTLVVDADPDTPTIMADEGQMKQVFMNLIKNAGEAMPGGGTLAVRTQRDGQMLRIEVSDTGCGISPENQERLFQEFFTTKDRGYGLGLHIVNTIVKRHGGNIEVESKIGEGTTFILHLPIESE